MEHYRQEFNPAYANPGLQGLPMERRQAKYSSSVARAILVTEQLGTLG